MTDQVEDRLRNFFLQQGYKPGDVLPREQDLAEALQVSRPVVREALSRLRMLGIVDSKKRRGMILTEPDILSSLSKVMDSRLLGKNSMKELYELRLVIEMGVSDLLFMRRNQKDLERLDKIVDREEKYAVTQVQHAEADIKFHGTLYHMTGNEILYRFQHILGFAFEYSIETTAKIDEKLRVPSPVTHRDLVEILRNGDPKTFRDAMREHLETQYLRLE